MNRRDLLKALGLMGASLTVPHMIGRNAVASVSKRDLINARTIIQGEISYVKPASMPTVINIFMYGGPSELAGNLSNIDRINADSQNKYTSQTGGRPDILQPFNPTDNTGQITARGFWKNAGGLIMEDLVSAGQMSVIRTINRVVDDTKAHRESIFSAQTGGVSTMGAPGMGTTLAGILQAMVPEYASLDSNLILPFVSFEGDTVLFDQGDISPPIPLSLRSVSLDNAFNNPYQRKKLSPIAQNGTPSFRKCLVNGSLVECNDALENLASAASGSSKFDRLTKSLTKRRELDAYFSGGTLSSPATRVPVSVSAGSVTTGSGIAQGTANFTGDFGNALRAAVVLALENPDVPGSRIGTRFITLSTGGLGGWDDHDNSIQKYEQRVTDLMSNIRAAMRLLAAGTVDATGAVSALGRNDVVINIYGEFGRNVNLNGSMGWDHGNNMNLYTFGGAGIPGRVLGQVVGETTVIGTPGQNRLFTSPTANSPQWEPASIAATVYRQFGVQNPEVLTRNSMVAGAANGFGAITNL